jgi:hypothetical protein
MSLATPTNFNSFEILADGMEVDEARNKAVQFAREHKPRPEYICFLDYDTIPYWDALTKLWYRASCFPEMDIVAGVYCSKSSPPEPLIYTEFGIGPYWDWALGDLLFNIKALHSGMTLVKLSLFDRLPYSSDNPWYKTTCEFKISGDCFTKHRGTEDLYFCRRAVEEANAKILVDTSVLCGHIDHSTGMIYGLPDDSPPIQRCHWMQEKKARESKLKTVLDLGAGSKRREWDGYKTVTTDLRQEVKPDYVMDTRLLNFPDDTFDMVASSHHLEHIGRWDQERVWGEITRILKPGGCVEHILPNLEWAAGHILDGHVDGDVYNVLFGAQENPECPRKLNLHLFGFTPAVAKSLAEAAGLVNVQIKTYRDDPAMSYEMVVTAEKPAATQTLLDTPGL